MHPRQIKYEVFLKTSHSEQVYKLTQIRSGGGFSQRKDRFEKPGGSLEKVKRLERMHSSFLGPKDMQRCKKVVLF